MCTYAYATDEIPTLQSMLKNNHDAYLAFSHSWITNNQYMRIGSNGIFSFSSSLVGRGSTQQAQQQTCLDFIMSNN